MSTTVHKPATCCPSSIDSKMRDREQTRARILAAAQNAFSRHGYGASIRSIASDAGITAALVVRYFGSKERLFAAAVEEAFDPGQALSGIRREQFSEEMSRLLFPAQGNIDPMAMMMRAALDPAAKPLAAQLARDHMIGPLAELIGGYEAKRKAAAILALVTGVWFYRFALLIDPFAEITDRTVVQQVTYLIQTIIDEVQKPGS
jgi:AcrR family transcriptional regulator